MNAPVNYQASCFCGTVEWTLTGTPALMAYCHCNECRHWSAGPVSRFTLWSPEALTIHKGADSLRSFDRNSSDFDGPVISERTWCDRCGGHVYTRHPVMGLIDVPAVLIQGLAFQPEIHVHYQETVLPITDGLPKFRDLPEPAGGSGELLTE